MVTVALLKEASAGVLNDLNGLMSELREGQSDLKSASLDDLELILANENIAMVVAMDGEHVVGVASLFILQKLGKRIADVEDVVVSNAYRGQGIGQKIMEEILAVARVRGVESVGLTSRPARVAGNKLYQKLGFTQKETNVYRLKL